MRRRIRRQQDTSGTCHGQVLPTGDFCPLNSPDNQPAERESEASRAASLAGPNPAAPSPYSHRTASLGPSSRHRRSHLNPLRSRAVLPPPNASAGQLASR